MKRISRKVKCVLLCFILVTPLVRLQAQSIFNMTEITRGGTVHEINPVYTTKGGKTILKKYPNIDINSTVHVEINTDKIREEAGKWITVRTNLPVKNMKGVSEFLDMRYEVIQAIRFKSDQPSENIKSLQNFSNKTAPVFRILNSLDKTNPLKIKINQILSEGGREASDTYTKIFDALQEEINTIEKEYKQAVEANKVVFRLGTFINSTPVHLEGFDSYKEGDYYFVPPFVTAIPEKEQKQFEEYRKLAAQANEDALNALKEKMQEAVLPLLESLKQALEDKFSVSVISYENAVLSLAGITDDIKSEVILDKEEITNFISSLDNVIDIAKDTRRPGYLKTLAGSVFQAYTDFKALKEALSGSIERLRNAGIEGEFRTALNNFETGYEEGRKVVDEQIEMLKAFFDSKNELQISLTEKLAESFLKLGDEVSKIPLESIPDQSALDLTRTIIRRDGDRLYFKAVLTKTSPEANKTEEKTIEFTSIGLYQIGLHNSIQAVLVLVDNLSGSYPSNKQFQFDPAYSVIFKWGNRKSSFYNDFVEFGFGLNMATLDFNNDDTPEVGIGVVLSVFKDYLQVGYGRNFGTDQNYWYFGLRIPFLGVNFGGKPKVLPLDQ